jgi:hypothetical protein
MHFRERLSIREIACRIRLSSTTIVRWLKLEADVIESNKPLAVVSALAGSPHLSGTPTKTLSGGKPSAEHNLYSLAQPKDGARPKSPTVDTALPLADQPLADGNRHDKLRVAPAVKSAMLPGPTLARLIMYRGVHVR